MDRESLLCLGTADNSIDDKCKEKSQKRGVRLIESPIYKCDIIGESWQFMRVMSLQKVIIVLVTSIG